MKWTVKPIQYPIDGAKRNRTRFALFPTRVFDTRQNIEVRIWLQTYVAVQIYDDGGDYDFGEWFTIRRKI
jgi:hypothetical protein